MGCSQSSRVAPEAAATTDAEHVAILVEKAEQLHAADYVSHSDAYALCRLGPVGSSWAAKPVNAEWRSRIVSDSPSPTWQLAFGARVPHGAAWELHVRVFDHDLLSADDFLGEVQVPLADLAAHSNERRAYPLTAEGGETGPRITLMSGPKVETALRAELRLALAADAERGVLGALLSPLSSTMQALSQWFVDAVSMPYYYSMMILMGNAWASPAKPSSDDAVTKLFTAKSDPQLRWEPGPFPENCITYNSYADVRRCLEALPSRKGSTNGDGEVVRENFLGFQLLGSYCFPEVPWNGIALAAPQEVRNWSRELVAILCGPGSFTRAELDESAMGFFRGRLSFETVRDVKLWTTRLQHRVLLGIELTEREASDFIEMQMKLVLGMALPEAAAQAVGESLLGLDAAIESKQEWLRRYERALVCRLPEETAGMSRERIRVLAAMVLDILLFAGGLSVPSVISYALALPYSQWGIDHLPKDFRLDDVSQHTAYILEVIRRFSPVAGVPYTERSSGTSSARRVFLNLQMAARDKAVWGDDAEGFRLRPLAEYHKLSVAFAEPALDHSNLRSGASHMCPGKELGLNMCCAFVRAFARTAEHLHTVEGSADSVTQLWRPRALAAGPDGVHADLGATPGQIGITSFGPSAFILACDPGAFSLPEADQSAERLLDELTPEERAQLTHSVRSYSSFEKTDWNTRMFTWIVQKTVKPAKVATSSIVSANLWEKQSFSSEGQQYLAPFGGLRFILADEDEEPSNLALFKRLCVMGVGRQLEWGGEQHEDLLYWGSDAEARVALDATFGKYLPAQYNTWDDLHTDEALAALCLLGPGGIYLRSASTAEVAGHAVPVGAALECNLEYMAKYETRGLWRTYGGTVYLGPWDGSSATGMPAVLGIWSCERSSQGGALVGPSEGPAWEEAKAGWKSSLGCSLTLRDHLGHVHWIYANGLQMSAREHLPAAHPLRRLLKQHYYCTASINAASKEMLMPIDGFAHRTFALTSESWLQYFSDLVAGWEWVPLPEKLRRTGLSETFLASWPFAQDALDVWDAFFAYVRDYMAIHFPDDKSVQADADIRSFWASFETHMGSPWRLPPLSLHQLCTLLTDLIWWVTAGHEMVGAIVEYICPPDGMPAKLARGAHKVDVQSHQQALVIIALTGVRQPPLIGNWTHLFQVDSWDAHKLQASINVVREHQVRLTLLASKIDDRNQARLAAIGRQLVAFNPRILETSVSI